jgi:hypothetical protein
MMRIQAARVVMVMTASIALLACGESRAQYGSSYGMTNGNSAISGAAGSSGLANPYVNPYLNPYMNPFMMQNQVSPGNAALYFFGAQAAAGGIGSGQISGVRPGPRTMVARQPAERAAENAREQPGVPSSVSRYFGRSQPRSATANYYNRHGRYYSSYRQQ